MTPEELAEELKACKTEEATLDIIRAAATQHYEEGYAAGIDAVRARLVRRHLSSRH